MFEHIIIWFSVSVNSLSRSVSVISDLEREKFMIVSKELAIRAPEFFDAFRSEYFHPSFISIDEFRKLYDKAVLRESGKEDVKNIPKIVFGMERLARKAMEEMKYSDHKKNLDESEASSRFNRLICHYSNDSKAKRKELLGYFREGLSRSLSSESLKLILDAAQRDVEYLDKLRVKHEEEDLEEERDVDRMLSKAEALAEKRRKVVD